MTTQAQIARLTRDWIKAAKEEVTIEQIGGAFYAFGSEIATLRLAYLYRNSGDKAKAGYSQNQDTWFFRLEM